MALFSFPAQVNERAARVVAGTVATVIFLAILLHTLWVLPLLSLGFFLRWGWGPKISPLARAAVAISGRLWPPRPVSGPPKRFAQAIGAIFTATATGLWLGHYETAAWVFAGMILLFATLESAFAFCMGCWVYGRLQIAGIFPPDVCVDCAPGIQS